MPGEKFHFWIPYFADKSSTYLIELEVLYNETEISINIPFFDVFKNLEQQEKSAKNVLSHELGY